MIRKRNVNIYFCVGLTFIIMVFAFTLYYQMDISNHKSMLNGIYSIPSVLLQEDTRASIFNKTNDALRKFSDNINANVKPQFNFGEWIRHPEPGIDNDESINTSANHIQSLRTQNRCPKHYQYEIDSIKSFAQIEIISNLTIANTMDNATSYGVNSSKIKTILDSMPRIVILTPISSEANKIQQYFNMLCSLTYSHELISIVLGEDSSSDKSYELALVHARTLQDYFHRVEVIHFDEDIGKKSHFGKHDEFYQLHRRSHMARARNKLLSYGLHEEDYVLWIDADVKYVPPDIIEHLLSADKDIIVPSCMTLHIGNTEPRIYDRNSWQETERSLEFLKRQDKDFLKLEGYTQSMRKLLPEIKDEGHLVNLDGVGGCVLLVKADCHRKGLIFPPFIFQNHIETEGLAKMAPEMGFGVFGYPNVNVFHV